MRDLSKQIVAPERARSMPSAPSRSTPARQSVARSCPHRVRRRRRVVISSPLLSGNRRIADQNGARPLRRAVVVHQCEGGRTRQSLSELDRIADGRRSCEELRGGAVPGGRSPQAPQHLPATLEPNTPLYAWISSSTTYRTPRRRRSHWIRRRTSALPSGGARHGACRE